MVDHNRIARDVLAAASLPQPSELTRAREGVGNHVFVGDEVVVRLGTGSDGIKFPRAAAVLRAARPSVKVPELLYADASCATFPVPVMVVQRMPGAPLSRRWASFDHAGRCRVLEQVAVQLAALHALQPGAIPDAGFAAPWWTERAARIEHWLHTLPATSAFPRTSFDRMRRYYDEHRTALLEASPAGVLHNDVNWGNVLVEGDTVTALLDFDDVLAGPPEEDAWALINAVEESDPPVAPRIVASLPGFDLGASGVLERHRLCEIENILELLTGELSWVTPHEALADAHEEYDCIFGGDHYDRMLDRYLRAHVSEP